MKSQKWQRPHYVGSFQQQVIQELPETLAAGLFTDSKFPVCVHRFLQTDRHHLPSDIACLTLVNNILSVWGQL